MSLILVTGSTGFVGRKLIQQLITSGHDVRALIRPSMKSPNLPKGLAVDVVLAGFDDPRGLRAAMVGVDMVYHLAGAEWKGAYASLREVDIEGTRSIVQAAVDADVQRLFYLSHLGSDRASAYPVLKAKAIAEEYIRRSGIEYTIFRSSILFGEEDGFTTGLGLLVKASPFFFLVPGDGNVLLQPLWVEDLLTCMTWSMEDETTKNQLYEIGGTEFFTFQQIVEIVQETIGTRRPFLHLPFPYIRALTVFFESLFPAFPISVYWLDYLAANRTCALDTLPRKFHLIPERFSPNRLAYLNQINWGSEFFKLITPRGIFRRKIT